MNLFIFLKIYEIELFLCFLFFGMLFIPITQKNNSYSRYITIMLTLMLIIFLITLIIGASLELWR